jgi:hypothetical protein
MPLAVCFALNEVPFNSICPLGTGVEVAVGDTGGSVGVAVG